MTTTEEMLLKELKAARLAIKKMNESSDGLAIGKAALKRINGTLREFRRPTATGA